MRVLVWREILLPGSETFIRNQFDALKSADPILCGASRAEGPLNRPSDRIVYGQSRLERLRRRMFKQTKRSRRLESLLKRERVDVVHAHFLHDSAMIIPAAQRLNIPVVVTLHGFDVTARRTREQEKYWSSRPGKKAMRYVSAFIAVSEFIRQRAIALGVPAERIVVLPIGIPVAEGEQSTTTARGRDIIFVGRLVEKKGVSDLLSAVASLPEPMRSSPITIIGDGPLRSELEQTAAAKSLSVEFLSSQTPSEVSRLLWESYLFVAPSHTAPDGDAEGFGMVFLEAASAGLPVVSYAHGGVTESVEAGVTGILVPEGDVKELAVAIGELLADRGRGAAMGQAGKDRVRTSFDISVLTPRLEELYSRVARQIE